jgi:hypothetical protein
MSMAAGTAVFGRPRFDLSLRNLRASAARECHPRPSRLGSFTPSLSQIADVNVSIYPARVTQMKAGAFRLLTATRERREFPVDGAP